MLATLRDEFLMKDDALLLLIEIIMFFLDGPLVVILMRGLNLLCPFTMLLTWLIFLALRAGNVSLIFKTSDVLNVDLEA